MNLKRIIGILLILFASFFLISCGKQEEKVIYEGMVMSKEMPSPIKPTSRNMSFGKGEIVYEDPFDKPIEELIKDRLEIITTNEIEYFVEQNTIFYITVKLSNPDNYEILSFELNGVFYQSYQFEKGSNSENLILEIEPVSVSGVKEYTIDKIKYVNGTEIRDVRLDGEQTIKVGVSHSNLPKAFISEYDFTASQISFLVNIQDELELIKEDNPLKVYLYDGNDLIQEIDLDKGENEVVFNNLKQNTVYQYAVVSVYNALTTVGEDIVVMKKHFFITDVVVIVDEIIPDKESVEFSIDNIFRSGDEITSIELLKDDVIVDKITDFDNLVFEGLLSNTKYKIKVNFKYSLGEGTELDIIEASIIKEFTTLSKQEPMGSISVEVNNDNIPFVTFDTTEILDPDETGEITSIKLYRFSGSDGLFNLEEILTGIDLSTRTFERLISGAYYKIDVDYEYDLNDDYGYRIKTISKSFETDRKSKPRGDYSYSSIGKDDEYDGEPRKVDHIYIELIIEDIDKIGLMEEGESLGYWFEIKIYYNYDDGFDYVNGPVEELDEVENYKVDLDKSYNPIEHEINLDKDQIYYRYKIYNLEAGDKDYYVLTILHYNLNDGEGEKPEVIKYAGRKYLMTLTQDTTQDE